MDLSLLGIHLKELVTTHGVPGAQFAVHHDGETWTWTHGEARRGSRTPMTDDAPVPVGSITKAVTAAAALVLVGDGDLELDEPLHELVPELLELPPRLRGELTLRHLLSHTGGLPSDPAEVRAATARRHVVDCCRTARPLSDPGRDFSYSNIGYLIVGHTVSAITGMTWWEAVHTLVLDPLGVPSRFVVGARPPADLVSGHSVRGNGCRPVSQSLTAAEAAIGALACGAQDLVTFARGLVAVGGLLEPGVRDEMCTPVRGADPFGLADGWGLGPAWYGPGGTVGHDGNGDGTSCHFRVDPRTGTAVALTTNANTGFAVWRDLAPRLPGAGIPIDDYDPLAVGGPPIAAPDACSGDYVNGDLEYTVARDENHLRLTVDGEPFADLTVHTGHRFTMRDHDTGKTDQAGRFVVDSDGDVIGLQVGGRLARKQPGRARLVG
jgi:CubicO group peptidase (beta-lactamase class C family)